MSHVPATRLLAVATAVPPHSASQSQVLEFMHRVVTATSASPERAALLGERLAKIYASSGIEHRHSVLPDFTADSPAGFAFFPPSWALAPTPGTAARMKIYERDALELAAQAARNALETAGISAARVSHLVVSTCTGFFAPGPDVLLIDRLGLPRDVRRTIIGFMGCYAGFNGIRLADTIVRAEPDAIVLQIAVELCSLHFQTDLSMETLVANCLFADGAAALIFAADGNATGPAGIATVRATHSAVESDSLDQMAWHIGDTGFHMRLSPAVPRTLKANAAPFVDALLDRAKLRRDEIAGWAIHPGGRRIVEAIVEALTLDEAAVQSSYETLAAYGNMSSATIGFVLANEFARHTNAATGRLDGPIAALGFGPGLTMESAVFVP